jgi:hypothetical protein
MSQAIISEIAITVVLGGSLTWLLGCKGLLVGLIAGGMAASIKTTLIAVKLNPEGTIGKSSALTILLSSQAAACLAWILISQPNLE